MKKKIIIWIAIILVCFFGILVGWVGYMASPTKGLAIQKYSSPRKALCIIDLQEDAIGSTATSPFPYKNSIELVSTVNDLIKRSIEKKIFVIVMDQEFGGVLGTLWSKLFVGGRLLKGQLGTKTDKRLTIASFPVFYKPKGDGFSNSDLDKYLIKNQINELYLVGADGEFCVLLTAEGARNRGYTVTVIEDALGIMNANKRNIILDKYVKKGINIINRKDY
jgi:nicotinamidase/pyrazinamidase